MSKISKSITFCRIPKAHIICHQLSRINNFNKAKCSSGFNSIFFTFSKKHWKMMANMSFAKNEKWSKIGSYIHRWWLKNNFWTSVKPMCLGCLDIVLYIQVRGFLSQFPTIFQSIIYVFSCIFLITTRWRDHVQISIQAAIASAMFTRALVNWVWIFPMYIFLY